MQPKLHDPTRAAQITRSAGVAVAAVAAAMLLECSRADSQRVTASGLQGSTAGQAAVLAIGTGGGYHLRPPVASGRITGSIAFDGPAPPDSIVHPTADIEVCGQTLVDPTVDHRGPLLANAVVWVDGVTAGKALPIVRRYDIANEGCRIVPRIQAVVAGGTLDVLNADQTTHLTRFIRSSSGAVLATVPETEAGAVVPSRAVLASAGVVEVRCDLHPWAKAWVLVFDQPYFTTTNASGAFVIDSVPPGRYRVSVWHERFGTQSDSITVAAGQDAVLNMTFRRRTVGD
jgi:Carboxypeptidase regulatory-like domain